MAEITDAQIDAAINAYEDAVRKSATADPETFGYLASAVGMRAALEAAAKVADEPPDLFIRKVPSYTKSKELRERLSPAPPSTMTMTMTICWRTIESAPFKPLHEPQVGEHCCTTHTDDNGDIIVFAWGPLGPVWWCRLAPLPRREAVVAAEEARCEGA